MAKLLQYILKYLNHLGKIFYLQLLITQTNLLPIKMLFMTYLCAFSLAPSRSEKLLFVKIQLEKAKKYLTSIII